MTLIRTPLNTITFCPKKLKNRHGDLRNREKKEYESCATGPLEEVRSILNILAGITHYILQWGINISY